MNINHIYLETIDSTNNEIKRRIAADAAKEGLVISAGMQTAGRGRSGHNWISPPGVSVSTSILLRPTRVSCAHIPRLTPLAAVAVAEAVEKLYPLSTQIKWPNDVLISEKKICGILTEMEARDNQVVYVIIGIGVNVHQQSFAPEIAQMATSLDLQLAAQETNLAMKGLQVRTNAPETHCEELTKEIWQSFAKHYEAFLQTEDLSDVLDFYNQRLINKDRQVQIMDPAGAYEGTAKAVDATGRLQVVVKDEMRWVDSGEVSVRGIYGYV